jgi:hypothetical protein
MPGFFIWISKGDRSLEPDLFDQLVGTEETRRPLAGC